MIEFNTDFSKQCKSIERAYSHGIKEIKIIEEYKTALFQYKLQNRLSDSQVFYFYSPLSYFHAFKDNLYFQNLKLTDDTIKDLFADCSIDGICINNLFNALKKYLKLLNPIKYYIFVNDYKVKYSIPYVYFLDTPVKYFKSIDNNLCFIDPDTGDVTSIVDSFAVNLFNKNGLKVPTYKERKNIFYELSKISNIKNVSNSDIIENVFSVKYILIAPNGIIIHKGDEFKHLHSPSCCLHVEYDINTSRFITHNEAPYNKYKHRDLLEINNASFNLSVDYFPKQFSKILYTISNGDITIIDELAEFFAQTFIQNNIDDSMTVFEVSKHDNLLVSLIELIIDFKLLDMSLKKLCDSKNIKTLINHKLNGCLLNISTGTSLPSIEKFNILKKLLKSKPFTAKDGYLGKKTYINTLHIAHISNNHRCTLTLLNNFKANLIKLDMSSNELKSYIGLLHGSPDEIMWIQTRFVLHGIKRLADKNSTKSAKKSKDQTIKNDGFNDFIKLCCKTNSKYECYAEDLYNDYIKFFQTTHLGDPLKRSQFVNLIKYSGKYKYFRPHHSASDNRYAFSGIVVDAKKLDDLIIANSHIDLKKDAFDSYLASMNSLVSNIL